MNTITVIVFKVLFPYGLSLSYILIHSVIFQNGPTNVSNSGKGVLVLCRIPLLLPRRGLGSDSTHRYNTEQSITDYLYFLIVHYSYSYHIKVCLYRPVIMNERDIAQ